MTILIFAIAILGLLVLVSFVYWRIPKPLKSNYFIKKWRELQVYCRDKSTWKQAIISADKLLQEALKKRKFKGKSPGEKLVSAQKSLSNNDQVWYAHNLYKKIIDKPDNVDLSKEEVLKALKAFQDALKDLGALADLNQDSQIKSDKKR